MSTTNSVTHADPQPQIRGEWQRVADAITAGAPVPFSIHFGGGASISYTSHSSRDQFADAAAMAAALGLTQGPIAREKTTRWESTTDEFVNTGESWSVWAHHDEPAPSGVDGYPIGGRSS